VRRFLDHHAWLFRAPDEEAGGTGQSGSDAEPGSSEPAELDVRPAAPAAEETVDVTASPMGSAAVQASNELPPLTIPNHWRTGIQLGRFPLELWAVIALFALPGAYIAIEGIDSLSSGLDLLDFSRRLALVIILISLVVVSIGAAFIAIAWMLYQQSRVGRGLAYLVAGVTIIAFITAQADAAGTSSYRLEWLVALAAAAAVVLLGLSPAVREVFTGQSAPAAHEATSIVIARVCIAAAIWANGVLGLAFLLIGPDQSSAYLYGLIELGVAGVLVYVFGRLRGPDRQARLIASAAAVAGIIATFAGPGIESFAYGVAIPVVVLVCLWITPDARRWFGDKPITVNRET
jgi:hypothetical protein